jgi:hypothetical protein
MTVPSLRPGADANQPRSWNATGTLERYGSGNAPEVCVTGIVAMLTAWRRADPGTRAGSGRRPFRRAAEAAAGGPPGSRRRNWPRKPVSPPRRSAFWSGARGSVPYPHTVRALADALGLTDDERASLFASVPGPRRCPRTLRPRLPRPLPCRRRHPARRTRAGGGSRERHPPPAGGRGCSRSGAGWAWQDAPGPRGPSGEPPGTSPTARPAVALGAAG